MFESFHGIDKSIDGGENSMLNYSKFQDDNYLWIYQIKDCNDSQNDYITSHDLIMTILIKLTSKKN